MMQTVVWLSARMSILALLSISLVAFSACGGGGGESPSIPPQETSQPPPPAEETTATPSAGQPPSASSSTQPGSLVVQVTLNGEVTAPEALEVNKDAEVCGKTEKFSEKLIVGANKGIKNVLAYLQAVPGATPLPVPDTNPAIDQTDCRYEPHVLLAPAGATVDIKNSDGILHNIHTYSTKNPAFNMAQPKFQKVIQKTFAEPEIIQATCDVHAWMTAWIVVQEHAYYALTDETGAARLTDVPAGEYDLKIWHETLGEQSTKVSVKAGEETSAPITLASQ
jgi:plastocyanin